MSLHFLNAWALLATVPAALAVIWLSFKSQKPAVRMTGASCAPGKTGWWILPPVLKSTGLVFLLAALARPAAVSEKPVPKSVYSVMIALDVSASMITRDMEQDGKKIRRLSAVKKIISDTVENAGQIHFGVTVFTEKGYTLVPVTPEKKHTAEKIRKIQVGMIPGRTTNLARALAASAKSLSSVKGNRIILLLTDHNTGVTRKPEPAEIAGYLRSEKQIPVYAIGINPEKSGEGPHGADKDMLAAIANNGGGRFFFAESVRELENTVKSVLKFLPPLKTPAPDTTYMEFFQPLVLLGAALWLAGFAGQFTFFRVIPEKSAGLNTECKFG